MSQNHNSELFDEVFASIIHVKNIAQLLIDADNADEVTISVIDCMRSILEEAQKKALEFAIIEFDPEDAE